MQSSKGYIMDIQPFSVNDGDGIRTTVFLAGCPLRCRWCSNPEGFSMRELVGWHSRKCIGCGECARVCPQGIGINLGKERFASVSFGAKNFGTEIIKTEESESACLIAVNSDAEINIVCSGDSQSDMVEDRCTACGKCVDACRVGARVFMVREMEADDVIEQIQKHRLFYMQSGGGITFSGGEATAQPEFLAYITEKIYDLGYSMDIETSGMFDFEQLRPVLERMDLIFMDLKIFDEEKHRRYTGVSNKLILENIEKLGMLGKTESDLTTDHIPGIFQNVVEDDSSSGYANSFPRIVIRIPVIGGVNDDDENIRQSAAFVHEKLPQAEMELLPYHEFGKIKYEALGMPYERPGFERPSKERMQQLREIVREKGVQLADFR